jgi:hypothetical protein
MVLQWAENLVQYEKNPPPVFPEGGGGGDEDYPYEEDISQSMDDLLGDGDMPTSEEDAFFDALGDTSYLGESIP